MKKFSRNAYLANKKIKSIMKSSVMTNLQYNRTTNQKS